MAEVYERGQIVIPKYIRDLLKIVPGTKLNVHVEGNKIIMETGDEWLKEFNELTSHGDTAFEETEKLIKEAKEERYKKRWSSVR